MDTAIIVISAITLIVVGTSVFIALRRGVIPRLKIYFPDGSTKASYRCNEETTVSLHIENTGTPTGMPRIPATDINVWVYAPLSFTLIKLAGGEGENNKPLKAPAGGIFRDMHSLMIGEFNLFYKEVEVINLTLKMPDQTGRFPIKVAILSYESDLVKELEISVV